jgi:predicted DNA-binding transcriptional regulator AlpA
LIKELFMEPAAQQRRRAILLPKPSGTQPSAMPRIRLVDFKELVKWLGRGPTETHAMVGRPGFPACIWLGPRGKRWIMADIEEWLIAQRSKPTPRLKSELTRLTSRPPADQVLARLPASARCAEPADMQKASRLRKAK